MATTDTANSTFALLMRRIQSAIEACEAADSTAMWLEMFKRHCVYQGEEYDADDQREAAIEQVNELLDRAQALLETVEAIATE